MEKVVKVEINNPPAIRQDSLELVSKIKLEIQVLLDERADKYGEEEVLDVIEKQTSIKRKVVHELLSDEHDIRLHLLRRILLCLKGLTEKDFKRPPIKPPEDSIKTRTSFSIRLSGHFCTGASRRLRILMG